MPAMVRAGPPPVSVDGVKNSLDSLFPISSLNMITGDPVPRLHFPQLRNSFFAPGFAVGASAGKAAERFWVDGAGNLSPDDLPFLPGLDRVGHRDR